MTSFTCFMVWGIVLLHLPLLCLWWACESRHTRIQKLRKWGYTWQQIANRYKVSPSTVRRWSISTWKLNNPCLGTCNKRTSDSQIQGALLAVSIPRQPIKEIIPKGAPFSFQIFYHASSLPTKSKGIAVLIFQGMPRQWWARCLH